MAFPSIPHLLQSAEIHLVTEVYLEYAPFLTLQPAIAPPWFLPQSVPLHCYFLLFHSTITFYVLLLCFLQSFSPSWNTSPWGQEPHLLCSYISQSTRRWPSRYTLGSQVPKNAPEVLIGILLNLYIIVTEKYDKFLHLFISCHKISYTFLYNLDFFYINLFGQVSLENIIQVQWHFTLSRPLTQHRPLLKYLTGLWLTFMVLHQFICHMAAGLNSLKLKSDSITPLLTALE